MPSTHVSLHCHLVFSTKCREPMIEQNWEKDLYKYIYGIIQNLGGVTHTIGGMPDHLHILIGMKATHCVANLMRDIKGDSSKWIHKEIQKPAFVWQDGYGAFSVGATNLPGVTGYINDQKKHHLKQSYQTEYLDMQIRGMVEYDDRYLW